MISYKYSHETIKGYKTSKLAQSETNDCVVRTLATAFKLTYNQSHKFCKTELRRKDRNGVNTWTYHNFLDKGEAFGRKVTEIKYEPVEIDRKITYGNSWYGKESYTTKETITLYTKRGKKYSRMTVGTFCKEYPKGTYILSVKGHTFAVIDSVVCGNYYDFRHKKVWIEKAWKID